MPILQHDSRPVKSPISCLCLLRDAQHPSSQPLISNREECRGAEGGTLCPGPGPTPFGYAAKTASGGTASVTRNSILKAEDNNINTRISSGINLSSSQHSAQNDLPNATSWHVTGVLQIRKTVSLSTSLGAMIYAEKSHSLTKPKVFQYVTFCSIGHRRSIRHEAGPTARAV